MGRNIVYYIACSVDGYIAGENDDISGFVAGGNGVEQYLHDLQEFDTVIMGKRTYEFGYRFGMKPGTPAYPHMQHYIFSSSLHFDDADPRVKVVKQDLSIIKNLKSTTGTDIYLCGGGQFAGWLLENEEIDVLKLKLNPFILGNGIKLFGEVQKKVQLDLRDATLYEHGLQILTYKIKY